MCDQSAMKDLKNKGLLWGLVCVLVFFCGQVSVAQSNPNSIQLTTTVDQSVSFTINSSQNPGVIYLDNATASFVSSGNDQYVITVTPNAGYTGMIDFVVQYYQRIFFPPFFLTKNTSVHIQVANGLIVSQADFVVIDSAASYMINAIANDTTAASGFRLNSIAMAQYGTASVYDDQTVEYTAGSQEVEMDFVLYTTTNDAGGHGFSTIYLVRAQDSPATQGTLRFTIGNTETQVVKLPLEGFDLTSGASLGVVDDVADGMVYVYTPNANVVGIDSLLFTDPTGLTRTVIMEMKDYATLPLAVDDEVYTAKNTSVTFDAWANDNITGNVYLEWSSSELTAQGDGVFTFDPPANFEGLLSYSYVIDNGLALHEASIDIFVGDQAPRQDIAYHFSTPEDNALVLDYDVPSDGYSITISQGPSYGFAMAYDASTTVSISCGDVSGKAFVIYTPNAGFVGQDSMVLTHCAANGNCVDYAVAIDVYGYTGTDCKCVVDCVWSGDTDRDGSVSVRDILPIARAMAYGGEGRPEIDYGRWEAQSAEDWDMYLPSGVNYKHIDADGDGIISADDAQVVDARYSDVHTLVPTDLLDFKDYPLLLLPQTTSVDSGDLLVIDIVLGTPQYPVENLQGLALGFTINPGFADSSSLNIQFYEDSWFAGNGNTLQMFQSPFDGRAEAAFGKANGNNGNGYGIIGQLSFIVEDEAEGFKDNGLSLTKQIRVTTDDVVITDEDGKMYSLPVTQTSVSLNIDRKRQVVSNEDVVLFPNPTSDRLNIYLNGGHSFDQVLVYDMMGRLQESLQVGTTRGYDLPVDHLVPGIYIVQLVTSDGPVSRKFVKK